MKTKVLMTTGSLMKVKSIAECSLWSILQYFWPALINNQSWKPILVCLRVAVLHRFYCRWNLRPNFRSLHFCIVEHIEFFWKVEKDTQVKNDQKNDCNYFTIGDFLDQILGLCISHSGTHWFFLKSWKAH